MIESIPAVDHVPELWLPSLYPTSWESFPLVLKASSSESQNSLQNFLRQDLAVLPHSFHRTGAILTTTLPRSFVKLTWGDGHGSWNWEAWTSMADKVITVWAFIVESVYVCHFSCGYLWPPPSLGCKTKQPRLICGIRADIPIWVGKWKCSSDVF